MRPFARLWSKLCVISLLLEIFRRLIDIYIAFHTPIATHAAFSVVVGPTVRKMRPFTRFWRHTERYFAFVGGISTFIRYFHFISHAECYVRQFHRRKKQTCAKNSTICSILKKTVRYIAPVGDILTCKRYLHCILHVECYAGCFWRRKKHTCAKNATIYSILTTNWALFRYCWRYFTV